MCLRRVPKCVLGLHRCVSEHVVRMCSHGVLECVLGMCPQSALAVSTRVSSSWPWHVLRKYSRVVTGCVLGLLAGVPFGCSGVCSQGVMGLAFRLWCAFPKKVLGCVQCVLECVSSECVPGLSLRSRWGVLVCALGASWSVSVLGDSSGGASQRYL